MAVDDKTFEYLIKAVADVTGFKLSQEEQQKILSLTQQQTAANNAQLESQAGGNTIAAEAAASRQVELTAVTQAAAVESQRNVIAQTRLDLIAATIAGDEKQQQILNGELAIRRSVLAQMQLKATTQAEINELCATEEGLLNANTAAIERQVLAEQAATEASAERIYGPRSRASLLLKNFLSPEIATAAGIGIFGGLAIRRAEEEYIKSIEKAIEERDKLSAKELESAEHTEREVDTLNSLAGAQRMRISLEEKLNEAIDERRNAPDDTSQDQIDLMSQRINDYSVEIGRIDAAHAATVARAEAEREAKRALDEQLEALSAIADKYAVINEEAEEHLRTVQKIEDIELGAKLAAIDRAEREGKITPQAAEKQRLKLQHAEEDKKFQEDQQSLLQSMQNERASADEQQTQAAQKKKEAAAADDKAHAEQTAADKLQHQKSQAANLDDAAKKARQLAESTAADDPGHRRKGDPFLPQILEKEKLANEAEQAASNAPRPRDQQINSANTAAADAQKKSDDANALADKAAEEAKKSREDADKKIAQQKQQAQDAGAVHQAQVDARPAEDADALSRIKSKKENKVQSEAEAKAESEAGGIGGDIVGQFGKSIFAADKALTKAGADLQHAGGAQDIMAALERVATAAQNISQHVATTTPDKALLASIVARIEKAEEDIREANQRIRNSSP